MCPERLNTYIIKMLIICLITSVSASGDEFYGFESPSIVGRGRITCSEDHYKWVIDNESGYGYSSGSLRSAEITGVGISSICEEVIGPEDISFYWRASTDHKWSEARQTEIGTFSFQIDDDDPEYCECTDWTKFNKSIDDESHTLRWKFDKTLVTLPYRAGEGVGWIDDLLTLLSNFSMTE